MAATCNEDAVAADAPELRRAAWDATQATSAVRRSNSGEDGAAIFARMLAIRAQGGASSSERHEVALTETLWNQLETVNREVNRAIAARSDQNRYGVAEYWAMPLAERLTPNDPAEGDCEDYALEKRARLIRLGWNADALALAVANAPGVGMHAVLIAQTDHGDFVLDNLHEGPRPPETLDYRWVSRQAGPSMAQWASARVALTPNAPRRRGADMLLAALEPDADGGRAVAMLSTVVKARS
jgi:predicted transglutaminase-like cysteine proteinase